MKKIHWKENRKMIIITVVVVVFLVAGGGVWIFGPKTQAAMMDSALLKPTEGKYTGVKREGEEQEEQEIEIEVDENTYYGNIVLQLKDLQPGVDYVESQVICSVESQKEAEVYAIAVGGTLVEFEDGIGVIRLKGKVLDLMIQLAEQNEETIEVAPNIIYSINQNANQKDMKAF